MPTAPTLNPGDTIGIMASSSRVDAARVDAGVKALEARGYKVKIHPQTYATYTTTAGVLTSSAGTPAEKVAALHDLWADDDVKAIMIARGGNEAAEMLPLLDYKAIAAKPKILIGFSDVTALSNGIHRQTGMVTYHGLLLHSMGVVDPGDLSQCFSLLSGQDKNIQLDGAHTLRAGTVQGRLLGGNLSVLCSLLGTPYAPDFQDGLLFIEDIGDELSRMNRFFLQLKLAGVFNKISGLIVGDFSDITDTGRLAFGRGITDMVTQHTQGTSFPVLLNAPFGHDKRLVTLPVGARATLNADHTPRLSLL
ncbi:MAG TPA: LD-carboxypeptidase [Micavibrio sp.]